MYSSKSKMSSKSFTRALALAFNEWILMLMLFMNSIFTYIITRFADYSDLQSPCLICSRLDHILKKPHWDIMICSKHKSEISSLVHCQAHQKLVDVRGMCETCLFSFATTNKSNAETYRLLVGKLGEEESKNDRKSTNPRSCTCCNQLWIPQAAATRVVKPETLPKIRLSGDVIMKNVKQSTPKKSVRFNKLPHVGYTKLKIHSDTESEAVFSEDESVRFKSNDHIIQTESPRVITLPYDLATDKLINLDNGVLETSEKVLKEEEIVTSSRDVEKEEDLIHFQDDSKEDSADALMEETELICLNDITLTSDVVEAPEDVLKGIEIMPLHDTSLEEVTANENSIETSKESYTDKADITSLESEDIVVPSSESMPENSTEKSTSEMKETSLTDSSVSETAPVSITSLKEPVPESESSSFNSMSVAAETNLGSGETNELLNLADAYNIIVHNESNKHSNEGEEEVEKWMMKKDTSKVSEDLKTLLTQISASRGIEFLSPRDTSPKIASELETKSLDHEMQMILQKRMLERNESNVSLEGISVIEIEGESESDRLKRQVDHDRKLLSGLYKELEEERSASAIATNQAMAMITRLQEEKALFQMEALQNLRMMEEQAEYDMEAIQKLNDLLVEREKLIQDLETEIEYFREHTPEKKKDKVDDEENVSHKIQSCINGFNEDRLYITSCLEKIENRVHGEGDQAAHVDDLAIQESVSELHERVERLKGDLYFLEHVVNSLGNGNESMQFVKEIASHLQTLRSLSMKRHDHIES